VGCRSADTSCGLVTHGPRDEEDGHGRSSKVGLHRRSPPVGRTTLTGSDLPAATVNLAKQKVNTHTGGEPCELLRQPKPPGRTETTRSKNKGACLCQNPRIASTLGTSATATMLYARPRNTIRSPMAATFARTSATRAESLILASGAQPVVQPNGRTYERDTTSGWCNTTSCACRPVVRLSVIVRRPSDRRCILDDARYSRFAPVHRRSDPPRAS